MGTDGSIISASAEHFVLIGYGHYLCFFVKLLLSVSFHHYHILGCIGTQLSGCNKVALPIIFTIS